MRIFNIKNNPNPENPSDELVCVLRDSGQITYHSIFPMNQMPPSSGTVLWYKNYHSDSVIIINALLSEEQLCEIKEGFCKNGNFFTEDQVPTLSELRSQVQKQVSD